MIDYKKLKTAKGELDIYIVMALLEKLMLKGSERLEEIL
jgi:hypothetical protein